MIVFAEKTSIYRNFSPAGMVKGSWSMPSSTFVILTPNSAFCP